MSTKAQIVQKAAYKLQIAGEGDALPPAETKDLEEAYDETYAELQGLKLVTWGSTADVPTEYVNSVATLVAVARINHYPTPDSLYERLMIAEQAAMKRIRELQAPAKMGQTEIENF